MTTPINLIESVRQWVLASLPYNPIDPKDADVLQALHVKDATALLIIYQNWMRRHVQPVPRRIEKAKAFQANPHSQAYAASLSAIETDVRNGRDLTKYLSKGIRVALKLPTSRRGASDLDMLLNDWGVHHLHLSTEVRSDGFVQRTGPLLFARFTDDAAYFLDVADHGEWTKESVADALVNEFPGVGGVHVLEGVIGVAREYTEEEHQQLRIAGVNTIRMVGDKAVVGGGYNLEGRSIESVRTADRIMEAIESFEKMWLEEEPKLRRQLQTHGIELPSHPSFVFDVVKGEPSIVETTTQTAISLG